MTALTVAELLARRGDLLQLEVVAGESGLDRKITGADISSPGLVLAGFAERLPRRRSQVLGETEIMYLHSLEASERAEVLRAFMRHDRPCIIVTKGLELPDELVELAEEHAVPLLRSSLKTGEFFQRIKPFLEDEFAPSTAIHGSLADVYGVGLLFVGQSGIGKSECVLDLVERGHRLVADLILIGSARYFFPHFSQITTIYQTIQPQKSVKIERRDIFQSIDFNSTFKALISV